MNFIIDISDNRLVYVNNFLKEKGFVVKKFLSNDFSNINEGDSLILSPAFKWNESLVKTLPKNINILAGNISEDCEKLLKQKNTKYFNLLQNEDFVLKNAKLTAEGVLENLIAYTEKSIFDLKILILGGGRVANAVGLLFFKLGLNLNFAVKDEAQLNSVKLYANNCHNFNNFKQILANYDVIINTIPATILKSGDEKYFNDNAVLFELASQKCCNINNLIKIKYVLCPALPSKYAPKSAGELIIREIETIFKENKF